MTQYTLSWGLFGVFFRFLLATRPLKSTTLYIPNLLPSYLERVRINEIIQLNSMIFHLFAHFPKSWQYIADNTWCRTYVCCRTLRSRSSVQVIFHPIIEVRIFWLYTSSILEGWKSKESMPRSYLNNAIFWPFKPKLFVDQNLNVCSMVVFVVQCRLSWSWFSVFRSSWFWFLRLIIWVI